MVGLPSHRLLDHALDVERVAGRRRLLTTLTAALGVPVWLLAIWPHALAAEDRRFLLAGFGGLLLLLVASLVREARAVRTFSRRVLAAGDPARRAPLVEEPGRGAPASRRP